MAERSSSDFLVLLDSMRFLRDVPGSSQASIGLYTRRSEKYVSRVIRQATDGGLMCSEVSRGQSSYKLTPSGLYLLISFESMVKKYDLEKFLLLKYNGRNGF